MRRASAKIASMAATSNCAESTTCMSSSSCQLRSAGLKGPAAPIASPAVTERRSTTAPRTPRTTSADVPPVAGAAAAAPKPPTVL
eukprot:365424-Chlamydomonas_euryale.AAC.35